MAAHEIASLPHKATTVSELALEANIEHHEAGRSLGDCLIHAWHSGDALRRAKGTMRHGEWLPWLAQNFTGSQQVASEYMRLRASYADPRSLPMAVGIRAALARAKPSEAVRRVGPGSQSRSRGGGRAGIRGALELLQDMPDPLVAALEGEADYDLERVEWQIDRVRHALLFLKERLVSRAPHSEPCNCAVPIPDDGYCFTCAHRLRPMKLAC